MSENQIDTSSLERHASEILIEIGALNGRMDRFDERLARIERPSQRANRPHAPVRGLSWSSCRCNLIALGTERNWYDQP
jgi:hypothetical protein